MVGPGSGGISRIDMPLKQQLSEDLKDAMRQRDDRRRDVLRYTLAALHNAEIEARGELDDEGIVDVLTKEAKKRRESIEEFRKAGREDRAQTEEAELAVLTAYLPEQLSREDVEREARAVIAETGASGPTDLGKVMPVLMQRLRGRADGRTANEVVRALLQGA